MRLNQFGALLAVLLAACSTAPVKSPSPSPVPDASGPGQSVEPLPSPAPDSAKDSAEAHNAKVCRQTMQHDESNYTKGGLYAPSVADAHPDGELDVSLLQEPAPRNEPKSRYGNKSPYTVLKKKYFVRDSAEGYKERGIASWYGTKFHGRKTSSQEIYDMCQFSAAHKTLPIPSYARVTRLDTGQSVIVRVNDRGPFHEGRIIDLSFAAASKLGINRMGTAKVEVQAISDGEALSPSPSAVSTPDKPYLQVASFSSQDNADALKDRLETAGLEHVQVRRYDLAGNPVWRVRIGPLGDNEMRHTERKLSDLGLKGLRVGAE
jgi:rare lipoprotein A